MKYEQLTIGWGNDQIWGMECMISLGFDVHHDFLLLCVFTGKVVELCDNQHMPSQIGGPDRPINKSLSKRLLASGFLDCPWLVLLAHGNITKPELQRDIIWSRQFLHELEQRKLELTRGLATLRNHETSCKISQNFSIRTLLW